MAMEYFHELGLAPDAAVVAAPIRGGDGRVRVRIWEAGSGRELRQLDFPGRCMAFTPGRSLIAAGDDAGQVRVWSLATGRPVASFAGGGAPIRRLLFGPDPVVPGADAGAGPGWLLAIADADGTIAIRAVAAGAEDRPRGPARHLQGPLPRGHRPGLLARPEPAGGLRSGRGVSLRRRDGEAAALARRRRRACSA